MNIVVNTAGIAAIQGSSGIEGAIGALAGINGVTIDRNTISGNVDYTGISINAIGSVHITQNSLTAPTNTDLGSPTFGIASGISPSGSTKINISKNNISGFEGGIFCSNSNTSTATGQILISENSVANFGTTGIIIGSGLADSTYIVINNALNNTSAVFVGASGSISLNAFIEAPNSGTYYVANNTILASTPITDSNGIFATVAALTTPSSAQMSFVGNVIQTSPGNGSVGINIGPRFSNTLCTSITGNQVTLQAPTGTNGIHLTTQNNAVINIEDFSADQAPSVSITGNVNLVPFGTCSQ